MDLTKKKQQQQKYQKCSGLFKIFFFSCRAHNLAQEGVAEVESWRVWRGHFPKPFRYLGILDLGGFSSARPV
jgi:hypothetical protein